LYEEALHHIKKAQEDASHGYTTIIIVHMAPKNPHEKGNETRQELEKHLEANKIFTFNSTLPLGHHKGWIPRADGNEREYIWTSDEGKLKPATEDKPTQLKKHRNEKNVIFIESSLFNIKIN
jgi:hypothetical protein